MNDIENCFRLRAMYVSTNGLPSVEGSIPDRLLTVALLLWSSRLFKSGAKLLFMLPTTSQDMELCCGQRFAIDQPSIKKHHQPSVIRVSQKQRIAGVHIDLPATRRFAASQP